MTSEAGQLAHSLPPYSTDMRVHPLAQPFYTGNTQPASTSFTSYDDVTTIFVVGFPDDMSEREFQNMFTFSPGFEAASLKWHCKDQEEDPANAGKKQMIGFARFRTRLEAIEAVEVLNGKRVDQERGTLLKAEMAKKNLHIKRGSIVPQMNPSTTTTTATNNPTSNNSTSTPTPAQDVSSPLSIFAKKIQFSYDSFSPLPSDLLSPADYNKPDPFIDPFQQNGSTPTTPVFNDLFSLRSQSFDARSSSDVGFMSPPRGFGLVPPARMTKAGSFQQQAPLLHPQQQQQQQQQHHHQHQQAQHPQQQSLEEDPFHYLSKSSPMPDHPFHTSSTSSASPPPPETVMHDMFAPRMSISELRSPSISSTYTTQQQQQQQQQQQNRSFNPADQNPPCNTLYVGNLPPNTSEDELRQIFQKCRGYKRMSFRTKPQGPMCFVEFDDVIYASQAMSELQGFCLSSSIKGGIRLSFSKNPLFTKPGKDGKDGF